MGNPVITKPVTSNTFPCIVYQSYITIITAYECPMIITEMLETTLSPRHCICPNESYTCHVNLAEEMSWITETTDSGTFEYPFDDATEVPILYSGGFQAGFSREQATRDLDNFTSTLFVTDLAVNGTVLTCEGKATVMRMRETREDTISICIIGWP